MRRMLPATLVGLVALSACDDRDRGGPAASGPAPGRFIVFHSFASDLVANDTNGMIDCFVHDRGTGVTARVSVSSSGAEGSVSSARPVISADGRCVAFESEASNPVANDTNGVSDLFVNDLSTRATVRITSGSLGSHGSGISD